jgi:ribosomal-protein-alanine N-acetyltransferase
MSFNVTHATRADLTAIMKINMASMPENYSPQFWTVHLNQFGDMFYVAKVDQEVVGYVMCREEIVNNIRTGLIVSVAVDSRYRGLGIGEELMKNAHYAMRARNIPITGLQVRKSNKTAIAMYNKIGYAANLTIPQYYKNPVEDGWLMTYVL